MHALDEHDAHRGRKPGETWALRTKRAKLIAEDEDLRGRGRASYYELERLIAAAVGKDLGLPPDALAPRLTAYTVVGGLRELYMTDEVHHCDTSTEGCSPWSTACSTSPARALPSSAPAPGKGLPFRADALGYGADGGPPGRTRPLS